MVDKEKILSEIQKTAVNNGGIPLGIDRFRDETGIRKEDWHGIYWAKWSDAVVEAGLEPNPFGAAPLDAEQMILQIAEFAHEISRIPTNPELKLRKKSKPDFPSMPVIRKRLGKKSEWVSKVRSYCEGKNVFSDVVALCDAEPKPSPDEELPMDTNASEIGHVYLLKHDKVYKIGRSKDAVRRYKEIRTQMPYTTEEVHVIETDDPVGIENYWHNRFKDKRLDGEWFELSSADVKAFKKRKFM